MAHVEGLPETTRRPFARFVFWAARRKLGRTVEPLRGYARSTPVLFGSMMLEIAMERAHSVDATTRGLAELRVASRVGCQFCLDIGSSIVRKHGASPAQLRDLHRYEESSHFSEREKTVLRFADLCTETPMPPAGGSVQELRRYFDDQQIVELAAAIAHENMRARLNHALGYGAEGFTEGGVCALAADRESLRAVS